MQLLRRRRAVGVRRTLVAEPAMPRSVCWTLLRVEADDPPLSLVQACVAAGLRLQWRHADLRPGAPSSSTPAPVELPRVSAARDARRRSRARPGAWPPRAAVHPGRRAALDPRRRPGRPPQSALLCRHRELGGERRIVTTDRAPPRGFELEYDLGAVRVFSLEGTVRLLALAGRRVTRLASRRLERRPPARPTSGTSSRSPSRVSSRCCSRDHPRTGQRVLVSGAADPLHGRDRAGRDARLRRAVPGQPARPAARRRTVRPASGSRARSTSRARRHRCGVGRAARGRAGRASWARCSRTRSRPSIPVWIDDGWLVDRPSTSPRAAAPSRQGGRRAGRSRRWSWRDFSEPLPRRGPSRGGASRRARPDARPAALRRSRRGRRSAGCCRRAFPAHGRSMLPTTL